MNTTYAQKSSTVQKAADSNAASVLDSSSQGESLQRKADMANNATQRAEAPRPNNTGMPDNLKSGIESLSGFSMDDVRVHYNSSKPATVQALAYTQGTDIHVAPGQEKCLPHEAWHVAQQMAGRVSPTTNINGMPVNDNAALEHEADVMGEKAVQCKMIGVNFANGKVQNTAVQRMAFYSGSVVGTMQIEGKPLFGREKGTARRGDLALLVDLYKKEMLTYIASLIQMLPIVESGKNTDFGPHISVIITGGNWYIAINSKEESPQKLNELIRYSGRAKEVIQEEFGEIKKAYVDKKRIAEGDIENFTDFTFEEQAIYIAYRWAAKKGVVVVTNENRTQKPADGCCEHGEMHSIGKLQEQIQKWWDDGRIEEMVVTRFKNSSEVNGIALKDIISFLNNEVSFLDRYVLNVDVLEFIQEKVTFKQIADGYITVPAFKSRIKEYFKKDLESNIRDEIDNFIRDILIRKLNGRVVRVGGSKTPCNDCADEMMSMSGAHNIINGRRIVLMSNKSGSGYKNWGIPGETVQTPLTTGPVNPIAGQTPLTTGPVNPIAGQTPLTTGPVNPITGQTPLTTSPVNPIAGQAPLTTGSVNSVTGQTSQEADFINPCNDAYKRGDDDVVVKGFDLKQDLHYLNLFEMFTSQTTSPAVASGITSSATESLTSLAGEFYKCFVGVFGNCKKIEKYLTDVESSDAALVQKWREKLMETKDAQLAPDEKINAFESSTKEDFVQTLKNISKNFSPIQEIVEKIIEVFSVKANEYEQINKTVQDVEAKIKIIKNTIPAFFKKKKEMLENIDKLQKEKQNNEDLICKLEKENPKNELQIMGLREQNQNIEKKIDELNKEIEKINNCIEKAKKNGKERNEMIDKLKEPIPLWKSQIKKLEKFSNLYSTLEKFYKDEFEKNYSLKNFIEEFNAVSSEGSAVAVGPGEWFSAKGIVYEFEKLLCKCASMIKTVQMIYNAAECESDE